MSRDPIQEKGGLNLYGFVKNDGVNSFDSLGLDAGPVFTVVPSADLLVGKAGEVEIVKWDMITKVAQDDRCNGECSRVVWSERTGAEISRNDGAKGTATTHEGRHIADYRKVWRMGVNTIHHQYYGRCLKTEAAECYSEISPSIGLWARSYGNAMAEYLHIHGGPNIMPYSQTDMKIKETVRKYISAINAKNTLKRNIAIALEVCSALE